MTMATAAEVSATAETSRLTLRLSSAAMALAADRLGEDTRAIARQCVLDFIAVTLAGARDEVSTRVLDEAKELGGKGTSTVIGRGLKLPALSAALVNGTLSHALDFDDVNLAMPGHVTVAVLPAVLALAEERKCSGRDLITAFVAGYELACRVGLSMAPGHYNVAGFHATSTVGSLGAAAACARLLGLDAETAAIAVAIAATQAGGLKSLFGTDCKPFHAGKAAQNGLLAARLAARGFTGRTDAIECRQGFASAHAPSFEPAHAFAEPAGAPFHIHNNLFKYHAACYLTHAPIEALRKLKIEHNLVPDRIKAITLDLDEGCDRVCNIASPKTGLEAKFSLRQTAAMALAGIDTSGLASYNEATAQDPGLVALRERVRLDFHDGWGQARAKVAVETTDGRRFTASHDAGLPARDVPEQGRRLEDKFWRLVEPLYGKARAARIIRLVDGLEDLEDVGKLMAACKAETN
jgi:2-methylcitrate dehydratase PrpD